MTNNKFSQPEVLAGYLQELKVDTQGAYLATIKLLTPPRTKSPTSTGGGMAAGSR